MFYNLLSNELSGFSMKTQNLLEQQIQKLLRKVQLPVPVPVHGEIGTCKTLYDLAADPEWTNLALDRLEFLSKRLDINKNIFLAYHADGRKALSTPLTEQIWLELAVAILLKASFWTKADSLPEQRMKRFNVLFKALDIIQPTWLFPESELGKLLETEWASFLQTLPATPENLEISSPKYSEPGEIQKTEIIPITVLFYEGPIARAYLETIRSLGLRPEKIIELVPSKDLVTKKSVGKWLPSGMRKSYLSSIHRSKIHYWPKYLLKNNSDVIQNVMTEVASTFGMKKETISNANALSALTTYSENVISFLYDDLEDKQLYQYLSELSEGAILYTGGGMVPTSLLNLRHLRYIHVHPGYLPDIRGADCTLWSTLSLGHTSASCFYMSVGIDTGDIIHSCWLPKLSFDIDIEDVNFQSIYRIVYSFIDPWVRAFNLREVLYKHSSFGNLDSTPQSIDRGVTFHFMHEKLRQAAFDKLFVQSGNSTS